MPHHFFIIGAQRSGTTLLRALLAAHPDVAMAEPVRPEPKHFLAIGSESTDPADYRRRWFSGAWHAPEGISFGEKSTSYLDHPSAARRIATVFPSSTIVVCVRDPLQRAISHYRFSVENGVEDLSIEDALTDEAEQRDWDRSRFSVSPFLYLSRGEYLRQLQPWIQAFGGVTVVILERLTADHNEIAKVYAAVGVDPDFRPAMPSGKVNASVGVQAVPGEAWIQSKAGRYRRHNLALEAFLGNPINEWQSDRS